MQATDCTPEAAEDALAATGNDVKLAILVTLTGKPVEAARRDLAAAGGFLRRTLDGNAA
jgi:N-acetylmuramic acid 6-phosphate etherase